MYQEQTQKCFCLLNIRKIPRLKKKGRRSGTGYRKVNSIAVITGNYRKVICVNVGLCVNR